jgi:hypothetical protein
MFWLKFKRRKKQEEAEGKQRESEKESDRQKIIAALNAIAEKTGSKEHQGRSAKIYKWTIEIGTLLGLWVAAGVAFYAVHKASMDSAGQRSVMYGQQITMQGQLDEMRAEQRPWLKLEVSLSGDVRYLQPNDNVYVQLTCKVTNVGHLPAQNVVPFTWLKRFDFNVQTLNPVEDILRFGPRVVTGMGRLGGQTIFPGETRDLPCGPTFSIPFSPNGEIL